jgi:tetratricopeptide (TPR) repeat protein
MMHEAKGHNALAGAQRCFEQLEELYRKLQDALPAAKGNPCGRCRECCTGSGLTAHNVTGLELDHIAARVGTDRLDVFLSFLARDGQVDLCPYFDEQIWGCGIYAHRPYSCRVFGHYRSDSTALPSVCVFAGQETIFGQTGYYTTVPLAQELRDLVRAYWPFRAHPFELASAPAVSWSAPLAHAGDALDRALLLMGQGKLQEALLEFEAADLPSTPYVLYCLSLVFEGLGRFDDASAALRVAKDDAPECVPLWFRLGCNLFAAGRRSEAEEAFLRTLALDSEHALAEGFLGGYYLSLGRKSLAVEHLRKAYLLEPSMPSFARLLEQAERLT